MKAVAAVLARTADSGSGLAQPPGSVNAYKFSSHLPTNSTSCENPRLVEVECGSCVVALINTTLPLCLAGSLAGRWASRLAPAPAVKPIGAGAVLQ